MDLIEVPQQLRDPESSFYLIQGPFALTHNGIKSIGLWLEYRQDSYMVFDGARGWLLDESYDVRASGDRITFYSKQWESKFVLSPLTQNDVEWLAPDEPDVLIEDLKEVILNAHSAAPNN